MRSAVRRRVTERIVLQNLEQNVMRVILYFDVFGHPLTADEVFTYLPVRVSSPAVVKRALESLERRSYTRSKDGFHFLGTASDQCVPARIEKTQRALRRLFIAKWVGRFISLFPFVRAVMLSGELSKGVAGPASDIDFVVVVKDRRLWICRTILIAFKKVFLMDSKKYFCLNHFITENNLVVESRNYYSALELATLKPIVNQRLHAKYLAANNWILEFFPNQKPVQSAGGQLPQSLIQALVEAAIPRHLADRLEMVFMALWQRIWNRRYPHLSEAERNHMFRCSPGISTAYGEDFQQKVLNKYAYRLRLYGLPPLGHTN